MNSEKLIHFRFNKMKLFSKKVGHSFRQVKRHDVNGLSRLMGLVNFPLPPFPFVSIS